MKIFFIIILLLIVSVGAYFWLQSNTSTPLSSEEKKTAMTKILDRAPILDAKAPRTWKTYNGKYASFSYPSDATIYKNNTPESVLESFSAGTVSPRVNLTVQAASGDSLDTYPAVALRRGDSSYKEVSSFVFEKDSSGAEKSGFFEKDGKIYSIVVSGYQLSDVEEIYSKVVDSVRF